jgi:hypothetical protein
MPYRLSRFLRDNSANVSVIFGVVTVVLCGAVGIAVDFSRASQLQTAMQAALDSAVLAGVVAPTATRDKIAAGAFAANLGQSTGLVKTVEFAKNADGEFTGTAVADMPNTLSQILGIKSQKIKVTSAAIASQAKSGKVCALILDPTASQALLVNSGAAVNAPDCEFHVKSMANPAAIFNAGSNLTTSKICIAGSKIIDNGGTHPNVELNCDTAGDPFAGKLPVPASAICDYNHGNYNGGNVTLEPGVYCGWLNFNANPNVTFKPGVYVIKDGGWNVNGGNWNGSDVTFYYADQSKIQFNSAVKAKLSAPTSGPYKGIFMFEKSGLGHSHFVLDDSKGFEADGLVYLPSRDTIFNSGSQLAARNFTLVVNTLILNNTNWELQPAEPSISNSSNAAASPRLTQ